MYARVHMAMRDETGTEGFDVDQMMTFKMRRSDEVARDPATWDILKDHNGNPLYLWKITRWIDQPLARKLARASEAASWGQIKATFLYRDLNTSVVTDEQESPGAYTLSQNYPNPFNSETAIRYVSPEAAEVRLIICDLSGQAVRTLVKGYKQPGWHTAVWDGRDEAGWEVASGIYLYRLQAIDRGFVETKRMLLLR